MMIHGIEEEKKQNFPEIPWNCFFLLPIRVLGYRTDIVFILVFFPSHDTETDHEYHWKNIVIFFFSSFKCRVSVFFLLLNFYFFSEKTHLGLITMNCFLQIACGTNESCSNKLIFIFVVISNIYSMITF